MDPLVIFFLLFFFLSLFFVLYFLLYFGKYQRDTGWLDRGESRYTHTRTLAHSHTRTLALVGPVKAAQTEIAPALVQSVAGQGRF